MRLDDKNASIFILLYGQANLLMGCVCMSVCMWKRDERERERDLEEEIESVLKA